MYSASVMSNLQSSLHLMIIYVLFVKAYDLVRANRPSQLLNSYPLYLIFTVLTKTRIPFTSAPPHRRSAGKIFPSLPRSPAGRKHPLGFCVILATVASYLLLSSHTLVRVRVDWLPRHLHHHHHLLLPVPPDRPPGSRGTGYAVALSACG